MYDTNVEEIQARHETQHPLYLSGLTLDAVQTHKDRAFLLSTTRSLQAENERLREALTPSDETKRAYMGEVYCDSYSAGLPDHFVPWISIKNLMSRIRIYAATKDQSHDQD